MAAKAKNETQARTSTARTSGLSGNRIKPGILSVNVGSDWTNQPFALGGATAGSASRARRRAERAGTLWRRRDEKRARGLARRRRGGAQAPAAQAAPARAPAHDGAGSGHRHARPR